MAEIRSLAQEGRQLLFQVRRALAKRHPGEVLPSRYSSQLVRIRNRGLEAYQQLMRPGILPAHQATDSKRSMSAIFMTVREAERLLSPASPVAAPLASARRQPARWSAIKSAVSSGWPVGVLPSSPERIPAVPHDVIQVTVADQGAPPTESHGSGPPGLAATSLPSSPLSRPSPPAPSLTPSRVPQSPRPPDRVRPAPGRAPVLLPTRDLRPSPLSPPVVDLGEPLLLDPTAGHCPVCAEEIEVSLMICPRCRAVHHKDCWDYSGGCAIFGCGRR